MTRYGCCGEVSKVSNIGIQKLQPPPGTYGIPFSGCIGLNILACQSAIITSSKTTVYIEETITFTINTVPTTLSFNVEIKDQYDNLIGSCTTSASTGTCTVDWDTTDYDPGEYNLRVTGQCSSDPITITLLELCSSVTLTPDMTTANIGDIVVLTVDVQPSTQPFNVEIRDQSNNLIESCTTSASTGICTINWNTSGLTAGQYVLTANVTNGEAGQCSSNSITIALQPTVVQAGFGTAGMIMVAGLAVGAIYLATKKPKL